MLDDEQKAAAADGQPVVEKDAAPPIAEPNLRPPLKKVVKNFDEAGAAQRVLETYGDRIRYVVDREACYAWDGQHYGDCRYIADKFALDALDKVHLEYDEGCIHVTSDGQHVEKKDFLRFQEKVRSLGSARKALKLACLDPGVQAKSSAFDANPYEITLLDGLLNLETLELAPHDPSQLVTKLAPVHLKPGAKCPFWEGFIDDVTCRDQELATYLQRLYGNGANGKSRFLGALRDIMGSSEYVLTLGTGSILNSKYHGIRCDLRQLEGMRVAFAIEVNQGQTLDEAVVKSITGGDELSARGMRENPVQFTPQVKILMAVNHLPGFVGNDHGIRRRIQVVPFRKRFDGSKKKEEIESQIRAEKAGIFAWMVRGFQEWRKQGLNPPKVVRKATDDYFATNDHIGAYLEERTESVAGATTPLRQLFEDYQAWAHEAGVKALGMHQFGDLLEDRGIAKGRTNSARHWEGIALKAIV